MRTIPEYDKGPCCRSRRAELEDLNDTRAAMDEGLISLLPEGLSNVGAAQGSTRLGTLMTLRWLAVAGQSFAVLFVYFGLGFELPLAMCLAVIAASAWLNVFLSFAAAGPQLLRGWEAAVQLAFDVLQLALLISLTGGLSNPFLLFLIAPVTVAASSLRARYTAMIAGFAIALAALMPFFALDLPWQGDSALTLPTLFEGGHFAALCIGIIFFALSAQRVNEDEAKMVRALDAAAVVMSREQRLSALGAMSAMTAHELGTPLATIHLVSRELQAMLPDDSPHREDAALLAEQAERCRDILQRLGHAREAEDIVHARMPMSALVEEAAAPHKGLGVAVQVTYEAMEDGEAKVPIIRRSPEILHALGAFIENAVSFADSEVRVVANWTEHQFIVTIRDDGPGFASEVMPKLGEPYVSQRGEAHLGGGDMGLGFFIAKTLIERTGGRIATRNRAAPRHGAIVQAVWPRTELQPLDNTENNLE
ncbi:MAG: ActS/PrrB/RegB family redox-sensitive histidine kinase [Henriciella sp.]|nr:ActS/PrrB/RegB family redox-sensitive histidine kinase [Henriciella sp.]MBO6696977.1 ActS/PrrB/RegB family redox-sensitive histidine kinase [Henriciella sp.]